MIDRLPGGRRPFQRDVLAFAFLAGSITWLWTRGRNVIGDLFDNSLLIAGAYCFERGWRPHVDFHTPVQSLPFLVTWYSERIFGPGHPSLALANLVVALGLGAFLWTMFRRRHPLALATLATLAVVAGCALQFSIVWYSEVGATLLIVSVVWMLQVHATAVVDGRPLRLRQLLGPATVTALLGAVKVTYFGAATTVFAILGYLVLRRTRSRGFAAAAMLACAAAIGAAGLLLDFWLSGWPPVSAWYQDVLRTPAPYRLRALLDAVGTPAGLWNLFARIHHNAYPDLHGRGLVGYCLLGQLALAATALWEPSARRAERVRCFLVGGLLYGCALVIVVTNLDISHAADSLFILGLMAMPFLHPFASTRARVFQSIVAGALCLALLGYSSYSILKHSRQNNREGLAVTRVRVDHPYFGKAIMGDRRRLELEEIAGFLDARRDRVRDGRVFFGPSLIYWYRILRILPPRGLPLWFHPGTTFSRDQESAVTRRIIDSDADLAAFDLWGETYLPEATRNYLDQNFRRIPAASEHLWLYERIR